MNRRKLSRVTIVQRRFSYDEQNKQVEVVDLSVSSTLVSDKFHKFLLTKLCVQIGNI